MDIYGAADGNRTRATCLGSKYSAIKLQRHIFTLKKKTDSLLRSSYLRESAKRKSSLRKMWWAF